MRQTKAAGVFVADDQRRAFYFLEDHLWSQARRPIAVGACHEYEGAVSKRGGHAPEQPFQILFTAHGCFLADSEAPASLLAAVR